MAAQFCAGAKRVLGEPALNGLDLFHHVSATYVSPTLYNAGSVGLP